MIAPIADHLWQSTIVAVVIALITLALRANRPQVRYALWLVASLKFLVPFAALATLGVQLGARSSAAMAAPQLTLIVDSWDAIGQPFSRPGAALMPVSTSALAPAALPMVLFAVWIGGWAAILVTWTVRWRRIAAAVRVAASVEQGHDVETLRRLEAIAGVARPIRLVFSETTLEPGVFGIWRPVLLWPRSIADHLKNDEAEAILAHEVVHVARRDNLAAALHMAVQAIFWFHPLVWWIGARLVDERERACDAEVIRLGSHPRVYAESILKTCELCVESPLVCVSGVTGSDLKKRIEQIMKNDHGATLNGWRKIALAMVGVATIGGPIAVGMLSSPRLRAQSSPAPDDTLGPPFAVISVKTSVSGDQRSYPFTFTPDGGLVLKNIGIRALILYAYQLPVGRMVGSPEWTRAERYDIDAVANGKPSAAEMRAMVRKLLADRFNLLAHRETREQPIYAMTLARSDGTLGPRLTKSACTGKGVPPPGPYEPSVPVELICGSAQSRPGSLAARWVTMDEVADHGLGPIMGRPVRNRTGIAGHFDLKAEWARDPRPPGPQALGVGPATFVALEEQLGLRLTEETGPVDVLVIDRMEKPVPD